ncbi:Ig-like domain-containing protein [Clostridium sp. Cult2]|uniref:Ig-like domain-containing protein n=1 Tax=Clostridium sp. Cult2 TaxID=2079003 RepID=UPI001F3D3FBE|nr:Ig-like domain-containing protein [Clostridium sp. Cult2]
MLGEPLERRDAVVLLSRLMGVEEEAKEFEAEGLPTWTDNNDSYYNGFLAWAQSNEYFKGHNEEKFGPRDNITVREYAVVLLRALGYVEEADDWDKVFDTAKDLGLLEGVEAEADDDVLRGQMAVMTFTALGTAMKDSDETLAEFLDIEMPEPEVLEVEEVVADNLVEIQVVFNKDVDVDSALNVDNYDAPKDIKDITYDEEAKTAIILLEEAMTNKKAYDLVIKGVKDDKTVLDETHNFTARDNAIPEVVDPVVGLGTKALKVIMSEPVTEKTAKSTKNYKLNGSSYYGGVEVVGREIILRPYGGLKVGENEVTVKGLEDFAGLKSIETTHVFEVVEDTVKPEVIDVYGTLERVVVEFSEDIDPNSVKTSNVYWMYGSSKKAPQSYTRISGNKYVFDFTNNPFPVYETTLYIEKFADYSGNVIVKVERAFTAEIDQTRPEVIKVELNDDADVITVKFNKAVTAEKKNFKLVNDSNDKEVPVKGVAVEAKSSNKVYNVSLYKKLDADKTYTLTVSGVKDKTRLENTIMPSDHKIVVDDYKYPTFTGASADAKERTIFVTFDKSMDLESIANSANYLFRVKDANKSHRLSDVTGVDITVVHDGKAVIIELPKKVDGKEVDFAKINYELAVLAAKDTKGNLLNNYGEYKDISTDAPTVDGSPVAEAKDEVEIKFTQPIVEVISVEDAFSINGVDVTDVSGEGTKTLTLTVDELDAKANIHTLKIDPDYLVTATGQELAVSTAGYTITDEIAPTIDKVTGAFGTTTSGAVTLTVKFDEPVNSSETEQLKLVLDFDVVKEIDGKEYKETNYTVGFGTGDKADEIYLVISLSAGAKDTRYGVKLNKPAFIEDLAGNVAEADDDYEWTKDVVGGAEDYFAVAAAIAKVENFTLEGLNEATSEEKTAAVKAYIEALVGSEFTVEVTGTYDVKVIKGDSNATKTITVTFPAPTPAP